jgi:hypothetical protein
LRVEVAEALQLLGDIRHANLDQQLVDRVCHAHALGGGAPPSYASELCIQLQ